MPEIKLREKKKQVWMNECKCNDLLILNITNWKIMESEWTKFYSCNAVWSKMKHKKLELIGFNRRKAGNTFKWKHIFILLNIFFSDHRIMEKEWDLWRVIFLGGKRGTLIPFSWDDVDKFNAEDVHRRDRDNAEDADRRDKYEFKRC